MVAAASFATSLTASLAAPVAAAASEPAGEVFDFAAKLEALKKQAQDRLSAK